MAQDHGFPPERITRVVQETADTRTYALEEDEVADGLVLTCQGEPVTPHVTVVHED